MINRRQFLMGAVFSGVGLISTDAFCYERFFIERNEFTIGVAGTLSSRIRIVQISDLHLKGISWYHDDLVQEVNNLNVDILLFTGDTIETNEGLPLIERMLSMFDRGIRKVAVPGNWEHSKEVDLKQLKNIFQQSNGQLLMNRSEEFSIKNKRLMITGIDDMMTGHADFPGAVRGIGREKNHIVLSHCPQYRDRIVKEIRVINRERPEKERLNIQYLFSGHTHGGQVSFLGYAPFLPPGTGRYLKGWYKEKLPHMYVSKGVGTSVFPVRFGARAEIAVFNYDLA